MTRTRTLLTMAILSLAVALTACKKEAPESTVTETPKAETPKAETKAEPPKGTVAETPKAGGKANEAPKNPLAALGQAMGAMAKMAGAQGKPLGKLVNWRELAPFLPEKVGEFAADGELDGSTAGLAGMQASTVKRRYKAGDRRLRLELVDTSLAPMIRTAFFMASKVVEDSSRGIKKGVTIDGNPGMLEWRKVRARGKVSLLIGERFMLNARLSPTEKPEEVLDLVKTLELKKLGALKASEPEGKEAPAGAK